MYDNHGGILVVLFWILLLILSTYMRIPFSKELHITKIKTKLSQNAIWIMGSESAYHTMKNSYLFPFHTRTEQAHSETKQQSSLKKFQQKFSLFKMLYISLRWNPPKMQSLVYLVKCLWKSTHKCLYKQTDRTKHVTLLSKRCTCFENWSLMKMSKLNWNGPLKHQFWLQENTSSKYHLKQNSLHHVYKHLHICLGDFQELPHIHGALQS